MARTGTVKYLGALTALLLAVTATPGFAGERREFLIELDGTFAEFEMDCTLIDGDVRQTVRRREFLPESYEILAEAVSCEIAMPGYSGRIRGKLYADGKLIASAAQNAVRPSITLRSDGPWGPARGTRSSGPFFRGETRGYPPDSPGNPSVPPINPSVPPVNPSVPPVDPWTPAPAQ